MDTLSFLRLILPEQGFKVLGVPRAAPYKGFTHHVVASAAQAAQLAVELDEEGKTVYHACASFVERQVTVKRRDYKTGEMVDRPATRVATNAGWCRSFWIDLDVGDDDPEKYATQREAAEAIMLAARSVGMPLPMLVSSGYGVHAYWPLDMDISADNWVRLASRLKALMASLGVKQDPSRTSDVASVLRPAGVHNRKHDTAKVVRVLRAAEPMSLGDFARPMLQAVKDRGVEVNEARKASVFSNDLIVRKDFPPSSADTVADKCQAIGHVRMVLGNVVEPFWRAAMGVVKHCESGDKRAHEWSSGHPAYDKFETQDKLDRWTSGPSTCESLKPFGQCDGCPFAGKVKSPIQLGVELPASQEEVAAPAPRAPISAEEAAQNDDPTKLPPLPESMKRLFSYRGGALVAKVIVEEVPSLVTVCQEIIVPFAVIRPEGDAKQGNRAVLKCWRFTLRGTREELTLAFAAVATGGKDLITAFGEVGLAVDGGLMSKYLKGWVEELKKKAADSLSIERMGWHNNDFIVGKVRYTPDGVEAASVAGSLQGYAPAFGVQGSLDEWKRLIGAAYGRKGQEQYQFLLACGFGAPLVPFTGDYRGVIVSAVSYKSGQGKTTAQRAAMSIYGDASKLETAYGRQTQNALYERLGAMGNLPFMIDEVSNIDTETLAGMAYAISQGIQKDRLNKDGSMRVQREPWQTLVMTSGNRSLIQALGSDGHQREPEMRRVFEFRFDVVSDLSKSEADKIFRELSKHYGVAGQVYLDYIVNNKEHVAQIVEKIGDKLNVALGLQREERFWGAAITSAIAGVQIAKALGLVDFDVSSILGWVKQQLRELRTSVRAGAGDEYDMINRLTVDLTFDLWVTSNMGIRGSKPAVILREPKRGVVAGRLVLDQDALYLRPEYVKEWCEVRRADYRQIRDVLIRHQVIVGGSGAVRDVLSGIANTAPMKGRVWELKASKLAELSPHIEVARTPSDDNVVNMRSSEVS